jgi:hypothetical protein
MMPVALFLQRLPWRIIGPAIGVLLAIWAAYSWAHGRGVQKERARLTPQLEMCRGNLATVRDGLAEQNAAIEALRVDERKARQEQQEAVRKGAVITGRVAPHRPALEAVRTTEGLRVTPEAVQRVWEGL